MFRNRNYNLLWSSQVLSELGAQISVFALPLLVLALTGSAVQAGAASALSAVTRLVVLVPAGALTDRWDRRRVMLWCELARLPVITALALALLRDSAGFGLVLLVAIVDGVAAALFAPAEEAVLPQVVDKSQLSTAVAVTAARSYVATLAGPGIGGLLFSAHRALPFLANALTYALSGLLILCTRIKAHRPPSERRSLVHEVGEGVRWIARNPVIRASLLVAVMASICFNALNLIVLAAAERAGVPTGQIGLIGVLTGAGGLAGALLAPRFQRLMTPRTAILVLAWVSTALTPLLATTADALLFGAVLGVIAFLAPTVQTAVVTYQMASTPDRLRGRVSAALGLTGGVAGAAGPLLGGTLVETVGWRGAVLGCAGALLLAGVGAALSPALRSFTQVTGEAPAEPALTPTPATDTPER
ncbi:MULTISPECIES: MFS transporter [unclassified Streptomyces]|uniref:MFS transporter n=1 Tax=unclassified Streptomyces TaxID=2593676 RepID=UPI002446731C|nr:MULTISPECIES: MFS transporter [Streptomyces]